MARRERVKPDNLTGSMMPLATTGETVTVACKLPHGLVLRLFDMEEQSEPVMGGGSKIVATARARAESYTLNGFANAVNAPPKSIVYGGFGMTYGVPKDFFERWLDENADSDVVQKGLVFAIEGQDTNDAHAEAVDRRELKSGMEAIDPTVPMQVGPFKIEEAKRGDPK